MSHVQHWWRPRRVLLVGAGLLRTLWRQWCWRRRLTFPFASLGLGLDRLGFAGRRRVVLLGFDFGLGRRLLLGLALGLGLLALLACRLLGFGVLFLGFGDVAKL